MNKIKLRMRLRLLLAIVMMIVAVLLLNNGVNENVAIVLVGAAFIPLLFNANDRGKLLRYKKDQKVKRINEENK